ncbi:hypothetical protein [Actinoplanes sp. ATCC 53533]|uniref:hypothetical protein n=1 Tax=Actinoplanes sp. ATCC 53533 TaxID=1288362 RepID=UPI00351652F3
MVLILECRSHFDIGDLPNLLAAELGVMTVRLERAIRSLDGVARVHVNRWGDGSAHLHMWFLARPYGRLQLRGTFLSLWDDLLPVIPEEQWLENLALVAEWLAGFGGRAIAEPPHIHWQSPSTFGNEPANAPDTTPSADTRHPTDSESDRPASDTAVRSDATVANAEARNLSSYAPRPHNDEPPNGSARPAPSPGDAAPGSGRPALPAQTPEQPAASSPTTASTNSGQAGDASGTGTAAPTANDPAPPERGSQAPADSAAQPNTARPVPAHDPENTDSLIEGQEPTAAQKPATASAKTAATNAAQSH